LRRWRNLARSGCSDFSTAYLLLFPEVRFEKMEKHDKTTQFKDISFFVLEYEYTGEFIHVL